MKNTHEWVWFNFDKILDIVAKRSQNGKIISSVNQTQKAFGLFQAFSHPVFFSTMEANDIKRLNSFSIKLVLIMIGNLFPWLKHSAPPTQPLHQVQSYATFKREWRTEKNCVREEEPDLSLPRIYGDISDWKSFWGEIFPASWRKISICCLNRFRISFYIFKYME